MKHYKFDSWDIKLVLVPFVYLTMYIVNIYTIYNNNNNERISKLNETEYTLFNIRLKTKLKMPEGLKT
jgi:hypothetical protein